MAGDRSSMDEKSISGDFGGRTRQNPGEFHQPGRSYSAPGDATSNRTPSTESQLSQGESQKVPSGNTEGLSNPSDISKKENSAEQGWKFNATQGPKGASGSYGTDMGKSTSESFKSGKVIQAFGKNKGKIAGGLIGVSLGGFLIFGGITMSGPMQFLHAAALIGDIANTIRDAKVAIQTGKSLAKTARAASIADSRLGKIQRLWAKGYEKKLAKSGIKIISDDLGRFTGIGVNLEKLGLKEADILSKMPNGTKFTGKATVEGANTYWHFGADSFNNIPGNKEDFFRRTMGAAQDLSPNVPKQTPGMTRILGRKTAAISFHPLQATKRHLGNKMEKLEKKIAKKLARKYARMGIPDAAERASREAVEAVAKKFVKVVNKVPVVGWITTAIDFGVTLFMERAALIAGVSMALLMSHGVSMEILSTASQIQWGDAEGLLRKPDLTASFVEGISLALGMPVANAEGEDGENYSMMEQVELTAEQYFYRDLETTSTNVNTSEPSDRNQFEKVRDTVKGAFGLSTPEESGTMGSSFWQSSLVQAEINGGEPENPKGDVPPQLMKIQTGEYKGSKQLAWDIANAAIEAVGVGVSFNTFNSDEDFNPETLTPRQVGSTTMFGARVTEKENARATGGTTLTKVQAAEVERKRREIVAEEFNQKPWYAKLFDTSDYRSAIASVARDSNWNLNSISIFNQIANLVKTVFSAPQLIAKNTNRMATSTYAYSNSLQSWYNIGSFGWDDNMVDVEEADKHVMGMFEPKINNFKDKLREMYYENHKNDSENPPLSKEDTPDELVEEAFEACKVDVVGSGEVMFDGKNIKSPIHVWFIGGEKAFFAPLFAFLESLNLLNKFISKNYSCGDLFFNLMLPKSGIKIDVEGAVIPIENTSGDAQSQSEKNADGEVIQKQTVIKTYNYQDTDVDELLTGVHGPYLQSYIFHYSFMVPGAAEVLDGSDESEEALSELEGEGLNRGEAEANLSDSFFKLIGCYVSCGGGGGGGGSWDGNISCGTAEECARSIYGFLTTNSFGANGNQSFTRTQAAAALGNIEAESGFNPAIRNQWELGGGNPNVPDPNLAGAGLFQWTNSRAQKLFNFANEKGVSWDTLGLQLQFLKHELDTGYGSLSTSIACGNFNGNVREATSAFMYVYESGSQCKVVEDALDKRAGFAQKWYDRSGSW